MENTNPVIIDLGKRKRKVMKNLKRGRGRAMEQVHEALEDVRSGLGAEAEGKVFVPVVLMYRRKEKKRKGLFG